jgi:CheY-like chemotaxis protein
MMKFDAMERGIAEALGTIDRAAIDEQLDVRDIETIEQIVDDLPALAWGDGRARSSRQEARDIAALPKYRVLIVGTSLIAEALLDDDGGGNTFACESTPDTGAALDLVRTTEPDLVVLDADLSAAVELVETLMDDPLTEAVPIVVVGSFVEPGASARYIAMGVARTVNKPTSREALRAVCEETLAPEQGTLTGQALLGEPTLEELGDRLANEVRDAIVGRADPSVRGRRIPLGQGTEVLGAVWGAIARVREVVTARSDGLVRFTHGPASAITHAPLLHEPDVARSDRMRAPRGPAAEVRLQGRRVVVADDDPGVVWFLADLLKTAGCIVNEAFDGQQALELAYKTSPDLIISDILMPNLDGFSLCRALRRDVALRDTPVILLSWKEDLLQRVRELGAGAAGYVRKESDTRAIIARVREALRTRGRIEARLREDGEVRGRLDTLSVRTLLEIVCATRPEARVSVRDATFLYEVEIRWGAPHRVTRTDGEGGFMKGSKVLAQLLGVSAGRFTVTNSNSPIEAELDGNLAAQLAKPIAKARGAMSLLTGANMNTVARVRFDEEALEGYLKATPERARIVARRLVNGAPPRELVMCGGCDSALLDDMLCDLAGRGFVVGVEGPNGEDLLTGSVSGLLQHADARAAFAPKATTPPPQTAEHACTDDTAAPSCSSPAPDVATSLEDAVLREVGSRSPEPAGASAAPPPPVLVNPESLRLRTSPPPPACDEAYGTPPVDQIIALGEPTVIDDTLYGEDEEAAAAAPPPAEEGAPQPELTPFVTVSEGDDDLPALPKKKRWPMVAFVAATGVVAWAVLHFSTTPVGLPKMQQNMAPPPPTTDLIPPPPEPTPVSEQDKADQIFYTKSETAPAGHGVIDVAAPQDAVVVVDGKERPKGLVTAKAGNHEVKIRKSSSEERGCTIDVRQSRIAHVKF